MRYIKNIVAAGALMLAALAGVAPAIAATQSAVTVANLNMRAGPGTAFPVVHVLPVHAGVTIYGCNAGTSWCDVGFGRERGWVSASYLHVVYGGRPVVVTAELVPFIGLTVVTFNQTYWNVHYHGRPWHGHWHQYSRFAAGGCGDRGCAGVAVGPRRVAVGGCKGGKCKGVIVRRTPNGPVVRKRAVSRP
ncbi:SH3 domain-containing protein [Labrenzia sp. THAF82]|uniref:SH3 domain-containing protein n=1 Tax=Labrenzia sp. THAF82 TaxID=2587861 RepID=UPI001566048F|nr:SH3 domain-containing protein [Labrenzia sp. THAF82]